ncbi:H-type small acid-soluble spore protein [Alkaliphilus transvaalensis]|uniref:H-type small acid-soluble spore protein n=1 Tax=Alkaliphilus transvaalensis TaxID=114628 RepID=UPI00047DE2BA|nr:H-type small acid-soluble spore protein [Alkaliphilus transvaalensis]
MDARRAQEIIESNEKIPVQYNGQSIWIAGVNPNKNTAEIKQDMFSNDVMEVPLKELREVN